ncbi:UNVERIFIED_CONTAM: photosensitized INA-labeled protein PHIL1 [Hammondia hammondi]|eukprot:XP_008883169.1 photosensitized INA-labeled protein PHIL1 [Hammondia hammondi]
MSQPNLQYAHTGAIEDYYRLHENSASDRHPLAQEYFSERLQRELNAPVIVHDRERPQQPPHTYIAGTPGPLHYGVPLSDGCDPGVYAVSNALFDASGAFRSIPLKQGPVFRRRQRGDCQSEWSNAFVSRVDPCECGYPEETYTPYEVARYRDQYGHPHTTLDFSR